MSKNEIGGDVGQLVGGNVIHLNLGAVAAEVAHMGQVATAAVQNQLPQSSAEIHSLLPPRSSAAPRRRLAVLGGLLAGMLIGGPTGGAAARYLVIPGDTSDVSQVCQFDGDAYSVGSIVSMMPTVERECTVFEPGGATVWRDFER